MSLLSANLAEHTIVYGLGALPDPGMVVFGTVWESGTEDLDTLSAAVNTIWINRIMPLTDSQIAMREVRSRGFDALSSEHVITTASTGAGGRAMDGVNWGCAILGTKRTGFGGRRNRGRIYLPGVASDTEIDENGAVSGALVTSVETALNGVISDLAARAAGSDMVILHSSPPATPAPVVTGIDVSNIVAFQRRRIR